MNTEPLSDLLRRWDEENAADALLTTSSLSSLPPIPAAPSERSVRAVLDIIAKGSTFASLSPNERDRYVDLTLAIERRTSFVTGEGAPLSEGKRLFLSFRAAHVLLVEGLDALNDIRAVVVYGRSTRLRRGEREAGLVTIELPAQIFRRVAMLSHWLRELEPATKASGLGDLARAVKRAGKVAAKTLRRCEEDKRFPALAIAPLLGELRGLGAGLACVPADGLGAPLRSIGRSLADQADELERMVGTLPKDAESLTLRGTSLHLSWLAVILGDVHGGDVMAHELTHVLHGRTDLVHYLTAGLPAPVEVGRSALARDLDALFVRATESTELDFLGTYAKTSASELLAVASEHYFLDAPALRRSSEDLHELLHGFHGPRNLVFTRRSSLHLLASFVGPLSLLRDG